jgi:hypothetical protein
MPKSKLRQEQEAPMEVVPVRMPLALERFYRRIGGGNVSEGVRKAGEDLMRGFAERRYGVLDRRGRRKG